MAEKIIDCLKENIKLTFDDPAGLSVSLVPNREVKIDPKTQEAYLGFPGIYEGALGRPLMKLFFEKTPFTGSLSQLIEIRKGLVENYFTVTDNLYGDSMYLLEFQKKIIDAGHWDAYNYFLFLPCFPEEAEEWITVNYAALEAFIDWYNNDTYTLGDGRSVNPMQIFDSYRPVNFLEALQIQSKLLIDAETVENAE